MIAVAPPSFRRERALIKRGVWPVAGCDEAGRGPLAGPVVAAAVVLDPKRIPKGIDDSKRLTAERREELFEEICATASFAVAFASPARIDRDNILRASLWALERAVQALPEMPKHVFVDGRDRLDTPCDCDAVIGGDGLVVSIAAASIIAKVTRDRLMCALAQDCPGYGFESHKGYGVPEHLEALDRLGPDRASPPLLCAGRGGAGKTSAGDVERTRPCRAETPSASRSPPQSDAGLHFDRPRALVTVQVTSAKRWSLDAESARCAARCA